MKMQPWELGRSSCQGSLRSSRPAERHVRTSSDHHLNASPFSSGLYRPRWPSGTCSRSVKVTFTNAEAQLEERVRRVCRSSDAASTLRLEREKRSLSELEDKGTAMVSVKSSCRSA